MSDVDPLVVVKENTTQIVDQDYSIMVVSTIENIATRTFLWESISQQNSSQLHFKMIEVFEWIHSKQNIYMIQMSLEEEVYTFIELILLLISIFIICLSLIVLILSRTMWVS